MTRFPAEKAGTGLADPADLHARDYDAERTQAPVILIHGCRPND